MARMKIPLMAMYLIAMWWIVVKSDVVLVPDENDGVLWNATFQLDSSYDAYNQPRIYHIASPSKNIYASVPAIIHFHGGTACGSAAATQTDIVAKAAPLGFLTVFGEGFMIPNSTGRKWSGGSCCGSCATNSTDSCYIDDVRYVSGVIQGLLDEQYISDDSPIFVSGHSNGGIMNYRLWCELGDKISGFAIAEGMMGFYDSDECLVECYNDYKLCYSNATENCRQENWSLKLPEFFSCSKENVIPKSVLTFQGSKDLHILIDGGECTDERRCMGKMSMVPYGYQIQFNALLNGCDVELPALITYHNESSIEQNDISECFAFQGCTKNTTYCIQYNGGHVWPGQQFEECDKNSDAYNVSTCAYLQWFVGPTVTSLHATELLVDFFRDLTDRKDF